MFTGLIEARGRVRSVTREGDRLRMTIEAPFDDLALGESVAVDGACLTVVDRPGGGFVVEAVATTRDRTTLGEWSDGRAVNLERALAVGDRLGGHFVQGHVDGVAEVVGRTPREDAVLFDLEVPANVMAVTVLHGSIAFDGVSLTVNALPGPDVVQVSIIPFTLEHTTLGEWRVGRRVHVEGDMLGKFVRAQLDRRATE